MDMPSDLVFPVAPLPRQLDGTRLCSRLFTHKSCLEEEALFARGQKEFLDWMTSDFENKRSSFVLPRFLRILGLVIIACSSLKQSSYKAQ